MNKYIKFKISNKRIQIYLYCLLISIVFLAVATKSSFLYPLNDWTDPNCFFTVGKGMMNGKVIYKDLFEQKGPLLYFIHGLAYLISNKSFFGVYIFEVISLSVLLYWSNKIWGIFSKEYYYKFFIPIIASLIITSSAFCEGDSAEEFILPLLIISLYYYIKYFKNKHYKEMSYLILLINGFIAGCVLWIKYTMLGFWFIWMMFIFIDMIKNKKIMRGIKSCIVFLFGMILATIPWIIYFAINNAIYDWINTYFIINITLYSHKIDILTRINGCFGTFIYFAKKNLIISLFSLGVIPFMFTKKYLGNILGRIGIGFMGIILILGVFWGNVAFDYYFLIFSAFIVLSPIILLNILEKFNVSINNFYDIKINFIIIAFCFLLTIVLGNNSESLLKNKESLVQYKFANIINLTEDATLLNYGFLDGGFYTATGIVPNCKYFCKVNISRKNFPEMMDMQDTYIKEKLVDYIVFKKSEYESEIDDRNIPYLEENYNCVDVSSNGDTKYYLYKVK